MSNDPIERLRRIAAAHAQDVEPDVERLVRHGRSRRNRRTAGAGAGLLGVSVAALALLGPLNQPSSLEVADPDPTATGTASPSDRPDSASPTPQPQPSRSAAAPQPSATDEQPQPSPTRPVRAERTPTPRPTPTGTPDPAVVQRTSQPASADRWCTLVATSNRAIVEYQDWCLVAEFDYAEPSDSGRPQLDVTAVVCRKTLAGDSTLTYPSDRRLDLSFRRYPDGPEVWRMSRHQRASDVEARDQFDAGACLVHEALVSEQTDAGGPLESGETYGLDVEFPAAELPNGTVGLGFGAR